MVALDVVLQLCGAFYVFAGFVLARAILASRVADHAIAALSGKRRAERDAIKEGYSLVLAFATFVSGVAVLVLSTWAVPAFLTAAAAQAVYLFAVAPRYLDEAGKGLPEGRRQSTNAFVIFCAVAAFVVWGTAKERLRPLADIPEWQVLAAMAAILVFAIHIGHGIWQTRAQGLQRPPD